MMLMAIPDHVLNTLGRNQARHASEWRCAEMGVRSSETNLDQFGVYLLLLIGNGRDSRPFSCRVGSIQIIEVCVCVCGK